METHASSNKKQNYQSVFMKIFKTNFPFLKVFKPEKSTCSICYDNNAQRKKKVLSPATLESIQKVEEDHFVALRKLKIELIDCIQEPAAGVEMFVFELPRPLPIPLLAMDETYDLRSLWLSNLCIFDEVRKKANMYV